MVTTNVHRPQAAADLAVLRRRVLEAHLRLLIWHRTRVWSISPDTDDSGRLDETRLREFAARLGAEPEDAVGAIESLVRCDRLRLEVPAAPWEARDGRVLALPDGDAATTSGNVFALPGYLRRLLNLAEDVLLPACALRAASCNQQDQRIVQLAMECVLAATRRSVEAYEQDPRAELESVMDALGLRGGGCHAV